MLSTYVISLREFFEVFLIIGVFMGISKKLSLHREKEIVGASLIGIIFSLILPMIVFSVGDKAARIFNEKSADLIEGYLMVFSGFFIAYVIFSLHKLFALRRSKHIIDIHEKFQQNIFDLSLFMTIIFFIIREGFEISLFTATTSLFSKFTENIEGLFAGFATSTVLGLLTFVTYIKFPISKVFRVTEYLILFVGAAFVKNGITELLNNYWRINIGNLLPIHLGFLPSGETSFSGHIARNIFGLEQDFSFVKLAIMVFYISAVYFVFLRRKKAVAS